VALLEKPVFVKPDGSEMDACKDTSKSSSILVHAHTMYDTQFSTLKGQLMNKCVSSLHSLKESTSLLDSSQELYDDDNKSLALYPSHSDDKISTKINESVPEAIERKRTDCSQDVFIDQMVLEILFRSVSTCHEIDILLSTMTDYISEKLSNININYDNSKNEIKRDKQFNVCEIEEFIRSKSPKFKLILENQMKEIIGVSLE